MNSAQLKLYNEWSPNIIAQKEVDFPNFGCSDIQYITSASEACFARKGSRFLIAIRSLA